MAALTASKVLQENVGSLTLLMVSLTTGSASDTWTLSKDAAVVDFWSQGHTAAVSTPDVSYVASTGVFTLISSAQGALTLFVLCRQ